MSDIQIVMAASIYLMVAVLFYRVESAIQDRMDRTRFYSRRTDLRAPRWLLVLGAALWPFQLIGMIFYSMKG